jgi:hypothetical protein
MRYLVKISGPSGFMGPTRLGILSQELLNQILERLQLLLVHQAELLRKDNMGICATATCAAWMRYCHQPSRLAREKVNYMPG